MSRLQVVFSGWLGLGLLTNSYTCTRNQLVVATDADELGDETCRSQWRKGPRTLHLGSDKPEDYMYDDVDCVVQSALRLLRHATQDQQHQHGDPERALELATRAAEILSVSGDAGFEGVGLNLDTRWSPAFSIPWSQALVVAGKASASVGLHEQSARAFALAIELLENSPPGTQVQGRPVEMEIIATLMDLSWQQTKLNKFEAALQQIERVKQYRPKGEASQMHFEKTIFLAQARTKRCANKLVDAEADYLKGFGLAQRMGEFESDDTSKVLAKQMNGLIEVYNWRGLNEQAKEMSEFASKLAGWRNPLQRPSHRYVNDLVSSPWIEPDTHPGVVKFIRVLEAHAHSLRDEVTELERRQLLQQQRECLHDPTRSSWKQFNVMGDERRCSLHTQAACAWLDDALREVPEIRIHRIGYSVVEPNTWIRPHTGVDNSLLKFHLGLHVPQRVHQTTTPLRDDKDSNSNPIAGERGRERGKSESESVTETETERGRERERETVRGAQGGGGRGSDGKNGAGGGEGAAAAASAGVLGREHRREGEHQGQGERENSSRTCTSFTVAGETRTWSEGGVLFFDDSFEHFVWNNCTSARSVFQVVIKHPALP